MARKNVNHVIVTDADADAGADADAHVENRIQNVRKGINFFPIMLPEYLEPLYSVRSSYDLIADL
jgi:hypothetical protein